VTVLNCVIPGLPLVTPGLPLVTPGLDPGVTMERDGSYEESPGMTKLYANDELVQEGLKWQSYRFT
jgi:hypothetical protein